MTKVTKQGSYRSDHSSVIIDISFSEFKKGKPLGKPNNSLLYDSEYLKIITDRINEIKQYYALPSYNLESINDIPNDQIQLTINDRLFLETIISPKKAFDFVS